MVKSESWTGTAYVERQIPAPWVADEANRQRYRGQSFD
jgi:hypothetical protein